jgi:hypothetical protein
MGKYPLFLRKNKNSITFVLILGNENGNNV